MNWTSLRVWDYPDPPEEEEEDEFFDILADILYEENREREAFPECFE